MEDNRRDCHNVDVVGLPGRGIRKFVSRREKKFGCESRKLHSSTLAS